MKKQVLLILMFILLISFSSAETVKYNSSDYGTWGSTGTSIDCGGVVYIANATIKLMNGTTSPGTTATSYRILDSVNDTIIGSGTIIGGNFADFSVHDNLTFVKDEIFKVQFCGLAGIKRLTTIAMPEEEKLLTWYLTAYEDLTFNEDLYGALDYITVQTVTPVPSNNYNYEAVLNFTTPETEDSNTTFYLNTYWNNSNISNSSLLLNYNNTFYYPTVLNSNYGINGSVNYSISLTTPLITFNNTNIAFEFIHNLTNTSGLIQENTSDSQNLILKYPRLNITRVYNAYTNMTLYNFSGNVSKGSWTYEFNTSNGSVLIPLYNGTGNYSVFVQAPNYAINNATNYQTLNLLDNNITIFNETFGLYSSNSVLIRIREESDSSTITSNVTVTVSGNASEDYYYTTTGEILIGNLTDGTYNIKFSAINYTDRTYSVSVADNSFQVLNAYLTKSSSAVTLYYTDFDSGVSLEGASISMSKLVNSSWVIVESKFSDITGRAKFTYTIGTKYRFYSTLTNYESKTFILDPIIFDSYTVRMNRIVTVEDSTDFSSVSIGFTPKSFYNDVSNNITFFFNSPSGTFESYSVNLTYPGGKTSASGTNAIGDSFDLQLNITGASIGDTVNITYKYDSTYSEEKTFTELYYIVIGANLTGTTLQNKDNSFNIPLFDRIFIMVFSSLIAGGVAFLFGGLVIGAIVSAFVMGYFNAIDFVPLWSVVISIVFLFVLISWGSSR
jgi:hypothetical protein